MSEEHGHRRRGSFQQSSEGAHGGSGSQPHPRGVQSTVTRDGEILLEGWLKKRGTRIQSLWSERYFVLKGDQLVYYLKHGDTVSQSASSTAATSPPHSTTARAHRLLLAHLPSS